MSQEPAAAFVNEVADDMTTKGGRNMGRTNIDRATGIRYGVIPLNQLAEFVFEEFWVDYGPPCCPFCGNDNLGTSPNDGEDYLCVQCGKLIPEEESYRDDPVGWVLDDGEYIGKLCEDDNIILASSPYYTYAQFCSPCAPGAGHLSKPMVNGVKTFTFDHEWFNDGKAPYPVYRVSDDTLVPGRE